MMQPVAISGAVEKPNSSAPSIAAIATSRPVFSWPSVWTVMRERRSLLQQRLLGLGEADLPRHAGRLDRAQRRGAGAAVVAGDQDVVGVGLRDAGGDRADADLGDELDRHRAARVRAAQVVDQLLEVLDRVDVVVRRRRDQADARRRVADPADVLVDLVAGQLAALAGLGALGHLDLQLVGVDEVVDRHAEAARGDLLDRRAAQVAVGVGREAARVLPALARVRAPPRRFIAIASVSCASVEIEPSDIAPVAKRLTISFAGSTSSSGTGSRSSRNFSSPRSVARRAASSLTSARVLVVLLLRRAVRPRTACWSSAIVSGFHMWCSPSRRHA